MAMSAKDKPALRDPFWPVGYYPKAPEPEKPVEEPVPEVKAPEKPKPAPPKPVTADDWKVARKLLRISGYALADLTGVDEARKTSIVVINRKHYQSGDTIKLTDNGINFVWRVGEIRNNAVDLIQESATRIGPEVRTGPPEKKTAPVKPEIEIQVIE